MEHCRVTLNNEEIEGIPVNWGDKLTQEDRQRLGDGIEGYDITPLMTRLARVNLFLHQFKSPRIHEYDTLTSEERWKDKYDCILANPPFMTPKGGVETHAKFRIRASKAEVLFSDYILEHLTPDGMAGFIVPEGIIFQNSGDYVELRKWLVEGAGLWAVVSLPAQIFQPYSGVKTSIIFVDRKVARGRDEIILVKVENDGYSLNTNRAPTARNDLPEALNVLTLGKKNLEELRLHLEQSSGKADMPKVLIKARSEFIRLEAYKAQTAGFSLIRKQYEKCRALEEAIKSLTAGTEEKKRARFRIAFAKETAEFFKIADSAYAKISDYSTSEKLPPYETHPHPNPPLEGEGTKGKHSSPSREATQTKNRSPLQESTDTTNISPLQGDTATTNLPPLQGEGRGGDGVNPLQSFFDTRLKEAVIAYGADRSKTGNLPFPLRKHLDEQREYNLSFDSYSEGDSPVSSAQYEMVKLGEAIKLTSGKFLTKSNMNPGLQKPMIHIGPAKSPGCRPKT